VDLFFPNIHDKTEIQKKINDDLVLIPDCELKIQYRYRIDTNPQLKEEEEEKERKR
jgi:hypothetical protein